MGLKDQFGGRLDQVTDQLKDLADKHGDQATSGLEKAAEFIDEKTGGKHSDKISQGVDKAKEGLNRFADREGRDDSGDGDGSAGVPR